MLPAPPAGPTVPPQLRSSPTRPEPAPAPASPGPIRPYARVLLKLSGEAFCAAGAQGIDPDELAAIAAEISDARSTGAQLAVVVGGGNFVRGARFAKAAHIHQATADYMGMLGTIINGLALKEALQHLGVDSRVMTAIDVRAVAEPFIRGRALRHLEKGRVLILVAGTGNPFCTTDTCAALRATELECDLLMKATKVDGVYSADPIKNPAARRYDRLTFAQAITENLAVMDITALAMCRESRIPVLVFDFKARGNIRRVVQGHTLGTLIVADEPPSSASTVHTAPRDLSR
jgi:uridylate kinase